MDMAATRMDRTILLTCLVCNSKLREYPYYICLQCVDKPICSLCESEGSHLKEHILYKVAAEPPRSWSMKDFNIPGWRSRESLKFCGQKKVMPELPYTYHKRLVGKSKMPIPECEALYYSFKCLVTTEIDPSAQRVPYGVAEGTTEPAKPEGTVRILDENMVEQSWFSVDRVRGGLSRFFRMEVSRRPVASTATDGNNDTNGTNNNQPDPVVNLSRHAWGAVSKENFCQLFPSIYTQDVFLSDFFYAIYDTNEDGLVDFSEFVLAHIDLTYCPDSVKLGKAIMLIAATQWDEDMEKYSFKPCSTFDEDYQVSLRHFIFVLRRLLYSYYDMSKYIFADAVQLQEQQLHSEREGVYTDANMPVAKRVESHVQNVDRSRSLFYDKPLDQWMWSPEGREAPFTDTRLDYDPIPNDPAIEGTVDNFRLEHTEQVINEFRGFFKDTEDLTQQVTVKQIQVALQKIPEISSTLVACVEAALI